MNEVAKCQELTLSRRRACLRSRFGILRQSGRNTEKVLVLHFDHQVHSYMKEQVSGHKQLAGGVEFVQVGLPSLLKLLVSVLIKLLSDQHQDINCIYPNLNQYLEKFPVTRQITNAYFLANTGDSQVCGGKDTSKGASCCLES